MTTPRPSVRPSVRRIDRSSFHLIGNHRRDSLRYILYTHTYSMLYYMYRNISWHAAPKNRRVKKNYSNSNLANLLRVTFFFLLFLFSILRRLRNEIRISATRGGARPRTCVIRRYTYTLLHFSTKKGDRYAESPRSPSPFPLGLIPRLVSSYPPALVGRVVCNAEIDR